MKSTLGGPHLRTLVLQFGALGFAGIPSAILSIFSAKSVIAFNPALSSILPKTSKLSPIALLTPFFEEYEVDGGQLT